MRVIQALSPLFLQRMQSRTMLAAGLVCVAAALSGCASRGMPSEKASGTTEPVLAAEGAQVVTVTRLQKFLGIFSPYRPVIQQGNFVSEEMLEQLKAGMTREQVRFVLGTPLLTDLFHAERWDYPFRLAKGNGEVISSRVIVFFKNGVVEHFEGGNLPTEKEYIARIAEPAKTAAKKDKQDKPADAAAPATTAQ
jgi:outer membrane protein assembly factor BamE